MRASSVQVVTGKKGIPLMIRDEWPFFVERWSDESGNEYLDEYRLVFDFREGLLVEITQNGAEGRGGFGEAREPPGLIGPFTLQLMVLPDLRSVVYDFAPRIGGSTNAHMGIGGNYSKLFLRMTVSMGRRICIELREAGEQGMLDEVLT